jgi:quercetin dioxygenase-like cupin family protein
MATHFHTPARAAAFRADKMAKVSLHESPRLFCDVYCLLPGQEQRAHAHADNDKIYHALTGTCRVRVGDETRDLAPGDTAIAPAGVIHGVLNATGEPATLLVVMAPNPNRAQ